MSHLFKVSWVLRALLYRVFLRRFAMPGYLGRPTFIHGARRITIDSRVRVFPGLRAEVHGSGKIHIHENVAIGQNLHVTAMGEIHIGAGTMILPEVLITDIDHDYRDIDASPLDQPFLHSPTRVGENCLIGMGARIQAGTTLGRGCVVGANAVVRGDFPDHSVIVGAPARVVKKWDRETESWQRVATAASKEPTN